MLGICRDDSLDHFAVVRFASHDGPMLSVFAVKTGFGIQTQVGCTFILVGAVAEETVIRQDRANIAIELYCLRQSILSMQCLRSSQQQTGRNQQRL